MKNHLAVSSAHTYNSVAVVVFLFISDSRCRYVVIKNRANMKKLVLTGIYTTVKLKNEHVHPFCRRY